MTKGLHLAAARRLVSQEAGDVEASAKRLMESASKHGIDFSLCFGTLEPGVHQVQVRQACLAVPGAGKTVMLFVSEPRHGTHEGSAGTRERAACIRAACDFFSREVPPRVRLAQALPEPGDRWAVDAFLAAGFTSVGTLAYLRAHAFRGRIETRESLSWPDGITVETLAEVEERGEDGQALLERALEASYVETLDCPELCGLRETADVIESHRAVGQHDPSWWWLLRHRGVPMGAMLLSKCPEIRGVELVYIGLAPAVRGRGLGRMLLEMGMARARRACPGWAMTCAVDDRNAPARRLYASLGFEEYARRAALVRPILPAAHQDGVRG
jgi:ribosomal protein S18 acetylase RimI-like enzyme